jgi:hypothetical protein
VLAGLARVRASGRRLGRPHRAVSAARVDAVQHLSIAAAARALGVSTATIKRWRQAVSRARLASATSICSAQPVTPPAPMPSA